MLHEEHFTAPFIFLCDAQLLDVRLRQLWVSIRLLYSVLVVLFCQNDGQPAGFLAVVRRKSISDGISWVNDTPYCSYLFTEWLEMYHRVFNVCHTVSKTGDPPNVQDWQRCCCGFIFAAQHVARWQTKHVLCATHAASVSQWHPGGRGPCWGSNLHRQKVLSTCTNNGLTERTLSAVHSSPLARRPALNQTLKGGTIRLCKFIKTRYDFWILWDQFGSVF